MRLVQELTYARMYSETYPSHPFPIGLGDPHELIHELREFTKTTLTEVKLR